MAVIAKRQKGQQTRDASGGLRPLTSRSKKTNVAQEYPSLLREGRVNRNHMAKMISSLQTSETFAPLFVDSGGIEALALFTNSLSQKKAFVLFLPSSLLLFDISVSFVSQRDRTNKQKRISSRDNVMISECLKIFNYLVDMSIKSILTSSTAVKSIARCIGNSSEVVRIQSVEIMEKICNLEPDAGPEFVFSLLFVGLHNE